MSCQLTPLKLLLLSVHRDLTLPKSRGVVMAFPHELEVIPKRFIDYVRADNIQHNPSIEHGRDVAIATPSNSSKANTTCIHQISNKM